MKRFLMAAAVLMATAAPAMAYTAYLKPNQFWSDGGAVEVQASYANQFFTPAVALPANVTVLDPDGNSVLPDRVAVDSTATNLATSLGRFGTYLVSTGEILGRVTLSIGVALLTPGQDANALIERADGCLYAAKRNGRNRVICETDPEYAPEAVIQVA